MAGFQFEKPRVVGGTPIRSMYDAAAQTQAGDYDNIMAGYDSLQQRASGQGQGASQPLNYVPAQAKSASFTPGASYERTQDFGGLVGKLNDWTNTGGYTDSDTANIRERALSPIRAAYGNAQRNLNRQKVLQGGYSPNHGAVTSKMAREQGELASNATTNVNAEIAKMIAANKLAGMQTLSPMLTGENNLSNSMRANNASAQQSFDAGNIEDERNVRDMNANLAMRVNEMNQARDLSNNNVELSALAGKTNLYGTNPALTSTFANQVLSNNQQNMQAIQTANMIKNQRAGVGIDVVNSAARGATVPTFR